MLKRGLAMFLLAALSACGGSPASTPVDGHPLSELLPVSVNGVKTTTLDMTATSRKAPKIFLKTLGRLGRTPPQSEVSLAYASDTLVYAFRVQGVSGSDILLNFVGERANVPTASVAPKFVEVEGVQVIKTEDAGGDYLYASADVLYTIEGPDDPTALDALKQLVSS